MTDNRKLLSEDIIERNIHGQHIFMSKSNSDVFTLNETASFIFQCLGEISNTDELVQKVIAEFKEDLVAIEGAVPNMLSPPPGCAFHPRCASCMDVCTNRLPEIIQIEPDHHVSCWLFSKNG